MQQEQRPPSKFMRWVKFLDRVQAWFRDEPVHKDYTAAAYALADAPALKRKEVIQKQIKLEEINEAFDKLDAGKTIRQIITF